MTVIQSIPAPHLPLQTTIERVYCEFRYYFLTTKLQLTKALRGISHGARL